MRKLGRNDRQYPKLSTEIGTNMFLECQKIDYYAKHCNMDPKKKGVVGKTSSYSFRTGIDYPKLRMEK